MSALRRMNLGDLVALLVSEHAQMKEGLDQVRKAVETGDYAAASTSVAALERVFQQHIADEEGQVLRILIDAYGVKGAEDAIKVFQQHRPIYNLMERIKQLASLPPPKLAAAQDELQALFDQHTAAEEDGVFPRAVSAPRR
jgi:hemerythrin-like domain-containing protein